MWRSKALSSIYIQTVFSLRHAAMYCLLLTPWVKENLLCKLGAKLIHLRCGPVPDSWYEGCNVSGSSRRNSEDPQVGLLFTHCDNHKLTQHCKTSKGHVSRYQYSVFYFQFKLDVMYSCFKYISSQAFCFRSRSTIYRRSKGTSSSTPFLALMPLSASSLNTDPSNSLLVPAKPKL